MRMTICFDLIFGASSLSTRPAGIRRLTVSAKPPFKCSTQNEEASSLSRNWIAENAVGTSSFKNKNHVCYDLRKKSFQEEQKNAKNIQ